jgi:hypothetical protein
MLSHCYLLYVFCFLLCYNYSSYVFFYYSFYVCVPVNVKVKFALEQAMKAQRESRGIALLFL